MVRSGSRFGGGGGADVESRLEEVELELEQTRMANRELRQTLDDRRTQLLLAGAGIVLVFLLAR